MNIVALGQIYVYKPQIYEEFDSERMSKRPKRSLGI